MYGVEFWGRASVFWEMKEFGHIRFSHMQGSNLKAQLAFPKGKYFWLLLNIVSIATSEPFFPMGPFTSFLS